MKTKKLPAAQYYTSPHLKPFSLQEVIRERVNREAYALSNLEYMPPIPQVDTPKFDWSEAVKHAWKSGISMMTI